MTVDLPDPLGPQSTSGQGPVKVSIAINDTVNSSFFWPVHVNTLILIYNLLT